MNVDPTPAIREVERLKVDRDEWRQQHENLLSIYRDQNTAIQSLRAEIEQLLKKDAAWLKTATNLRGRLVETIEALNNIAALDYTRAATNTCAAVAVRIAKEALLTKESDDAG